MESKTRKFPLSEAVEALTEAGYVVLTTEQAEETLALLGGMAFADPGVFPIPERALALLQTWPPMVSNQETKEEA